METKQFIKELSSRTGRSLTEIENLVDGLSSVIMERCAEMDSIAIPGFGTFEPKKRGERVKVNPSTGKRILLPPKITLNFKMSAVMKQKLQ